MLDIEVINGSPALGDVARMALEALAITQGHVAIEIVDAARITELNSAYRNNLQPTDVLSFPIDETEPAHGLRELGDVVICPEHTEDMKEAVVHGVLHLCGYDHESDEGQMMELQADVMDRVRHGLGS